MTTQRLPVWLRRSLSVPTANPTHQTIGRYRLNTVCESALCPNRNECYGSGTATFMILGDICTRRCSFCAIDAGKPIPVEADEPDRVAEAVRDMRLSYVVVTSVARDDLKDEGAGHFASVVRRVKEVNPGVQVEVLTPDFHARPELIAVVIESGPVVFNHNIETVESLQKSVRPQASYHRSLKVIETIKQIDPNMTTKSGMMLGMGERVQEIRQTGRDLLSAGCDILTLGQYLPPGKEFPSVVEYVSPETFGEWANEFKALGFREVFAGPYVRSSYHADEAFSGAIHRGQSNIPIRNDAL